MQKIYNKNLFAHPSLDYSLMLDKVKAETYYNSKKEVVKSVNYEYDFWIVIIMFSISTLRLHLYTCVRGCICMLVRKAFPLMS